MTESMKVIMYVAVISILSEILLGEELDKEDWDELGDSLGFLGIEISEFMSEGDSMLVVLQKICQEFGAISITQDILDEIRKQDQLV
ncbi:hypothetical protein BRE01_17780 [Brevibacillus reuszeri]|uniref:Uncharacterized protein n=1 Tax=Brevibacillus reuszeri TaxID=54915 RepID=A0A0K9Z0B0_9BACL|nr:hypothetical protein [Brevibacillus reuszeri]KNB74336.1 hypothetical protein ADS79_01115 [Brevibacillus reuszeri]MED1856235.1 hypothetical protein [Brevibacillus reuszeri]GED68076.1 hypothetical protein BRE01_17780 [Brevibacillus reuszeri]